MNKHDLLVSELTERQAKNIIAAVLDISQRDGKIHLRYDQWVNLVEITRDRGQEMTDTEITVILRELEVAHVSTGYAGATTFSEAARAIRYLQRERDCLLNDLYYLEHGAEVTC